MASSARTLQPLSGHWMLSETPSCTILVERYSAQHDRQNRWPHSRPAAATSEDGSFSRGRKQISQSVEAAAGLTCSSLGLLDGEGV